MKILFLTYDVTEAISYYRVAGVTEHLSKITNHDITLMQWSNIGETTWPMLINGNYDIIFFSRPFTKDVKEFLFYAKLCGKRIWIDHDDNLLSVNPENKYYTTYMKEEVKQTICDIVSIADVVSVTTDFLRDVYLKYNKNIWVIPNAFNDIILKRTKPRERSKTIFWRGSDSHIFNLWSYGKEIISTIDEFNDWKFTFMGYYPWFIPKGWGYIESTDIMLYFHTLKVIAPSVFHSPINNDNFNNCRSAISVIEAAYCGAASIVPSFWTYKGQSPIPGTITYNDNKSYYEALKACCSGDVDFEKQSEITWEYVSDMWSLSNINKIRVELIKTLE